MPIMKGDLGDFMMMKGRSGLQYVDENGTEYFMDCEMVSNEEYDFAIYPDSIEFIDSDQEIPETSKNRIRERIQKICTQYDLKVYFFNDDVY